MKENRVKRRARLVPKPQGGVLVSFAVLAALVAAVFLIGGSSGSHPAAPSLHEGAARGEELYVQYCAPCHARTGAGQPEAGIPPLNEDGAAWLQDEAYLRAHILDGGETMPALSGLVSKTDADLILAYIQHWWSAEQLEAYKNQTP